VVVVGGGQAGLAVSYELTALEVGHVVLERGRVGQTWRDRWDSFSLVTPNWSVQLPGGAYGGDDPDGFMPRDEVVRHLESYATSKPRFLERALRRQRRSAYRPAAERQTLGCPRRSGRHPGLGNVRMAMVLCHSL
jgi:cation diffusion facilitator CzcD-associated flavoprotein CzcO